MTPDGQPVQARFKRLLNGQIKVTPDGNSERLL